MKKIIVFSVSLSILLLAGNSCKKNDKEPNRKECKLVTITDAANGSVSFFNITYNNDGEIASVQRTGSSGFTKTFSYNGNTILVTTSSNGNITTLDSIQVNNNRMMTYYQSKDLNSGSKTVNTFTYAGNGELLKSTSQFGSGTISTSTYTHSNGDITSLSDGSFTTSLTYYADKTNTEGDYLKVLQLINYGAIYLKSTHLLKSIISGNSIQNFIYEFDSDGKITQLTASNGTSTEVLSYQYDCN